MSLNHSRNYAEKRDFMRMTVDTPIILTTLDGGQQYRGVCKNLSGTGMSVETDQYFCADTELNTSLPSNNEALPAFNTTVRVIRCTETQSDRFLMGAEIISVSNA